MTSPKTSTRIVINNVANNPPFFSPNFLTNKIVANDAIKILTKLLATRIPPIVFSKESLAFLILEFFFESDSWRIFSLGMIVMAVSDPDNMADSTRHVAIKMYRTRSKLVFKFL